MKAFGFLFFLIFIFLLFICAYNAWVISPLGFLEKPKKAILLEALLTCASSRESFYLGKSKPSEIFS
jgi:hypothetical protein